MIVDTSALVAVLRAEEGADAIIRALFSERGFIPAPVIFEFHRVTSERFNEPSRPALDLLAQVLAQDVGIIALTDAECDHAADLNQRLGSGNERGGKLNMLDLMVFAVAMVRGLPILCTGVDFLAANAPLHPASRRG